MRRILLAGAAFFPLAAHAQTPISQLPSASVVKGSDIAPITQDGATKKTTINNMVGAVAPLLSNNLADLPNKAAARANLGALGINKLITSGSINDNGALTLTLGDGSIVPVNGEIKSVPGPAGQPGPPGPPGADGGVTIPAAQLLSGNGSVLTGVTIGSGLGLNGGVLSATAPTISVPAAPLLSGTGSAIAAATSGSVTATLGYAPLNPASNGSDFANPAAVRSNLGLGSVATLSGIAVTGDAAGTLSGNSIAVTLPAVNSNTTSCGSATTVCQTTANAKGLTTVNTGVAIAVPHTAVTDWDGTVASALSPYTPTSSLNPVATQAPVASAAFVGTNSTGQVIAKTLGSSDVTGALGYTPPTPSAIAATYAPITSPALTGTPTVPTPSTNANDQTAVNAAWVKLQGYTTVSGTKFAGTWNASTNSPALASGTAPALGTGARYSVSAAGSTNLDGISAWSAGDSAIWNGTTWTREPYVGGGVTDIAGRAGSVSLAVTDVSGAFPAASAGPLATQAAVVSAPFVKTTSAGLLAPTSIVPTDLPVATSTTNGAARPDGTTTSINSGVLSVILGSGSAASYSDSRITGAQQTSQKGVASGYAPLDATALVPTANLRLAAVAAPGTVVIPQEGLTVANDGSLRTNNQLFLTDIETALTRIPVYPLSAVWIWNNNGQPTRRATTYAGSDPNQAFLFAQIGGAPNAPGATGTLWWNNDNLARVDGAYTIPSSAAVNHDVNAAFAYVPTYPGAPTSLFGNGALIQAVAAGDAGGGVVGATGPQGPQGVKGDTGDTGPAGPVGLSGGLLASRPPATGSGNTYLVTDSTVSCTYRDTSTGVWTPIGTCANAVPAALPGTSAGNFYITTATAGVAAVKTGNTTGGPQLYSTALGSIAGSNIGAGSGTPAIGVLGGAASGKSVVTTDFTTAAPPTTGECLTWVAGAKVGSLACGGITGNFSGDVTVDGTFLYAGVATAYQYRSTGSAITLACTDPSDQLIRATANLTVTLPATGSCTTVRTYRIHNMSTSGSFTVQPRSATGSLVGSARAAGQTTVAVYVSQASIWEPM